MVQSTGPFPARLGARSFYLEISHFLRSRYGHRIWARTSQCNQHIPPNKLCQYRGFHQTKRIHQENGLTPDLSNAPHQFKNSFNWPKPTVSVGDVPALAKKLNEKVVLTGYLGKRKDLAKGLCFVSLENPALGENIQIISTLNHASPERQIAHEKLKMVRPRTPVVVTGILQAKIGSGNSEQRSALPEFEVLLEDIQSLNEFPSDLIAESDTRFPANQRHLQLRVDPSLRQALRLRADMRDLCSQKLRSDGMVDIETPLLFKSTSEGAREFIVPTRKKGLAYALPQSPQQFKQILMASGIDKYFQFARCFRDEDLRADRQPEFTQLDIELAFQDGHGIMSLIENLIVKPLWERFLNITLPDKFPRMTYEHAMSRFGSDKPDLRSSIQAFQRIDYMLPVDLTKKISSLNNPVVDAMVVPLEVEPKGARKFVARFLDSPDALPYNTNPDGGPGVFIYNSRAPLQGLAPFGFEAAEEMERKFGLQDGHLIILQARKDGPLTGGSTALGDMRTALFNAAVSEDLLAAPAWTDFKPLWVTDFPLFSPSDPSEPGQGGHAGFASTHHPFTSPKTVEDVDLLLTDPTQAIGDHYDLVINGEEIGGGSRRIHHADMQELVFRDILKMDDERVSEFSHLIDALRAGCPPHAGIALGFDRLVAMIQSCKRERRVSMRDVIAFPKSGKGEDLMVKSPSPINNEVLKTYHLQYDD